MRYPTKKTLVNSRTASPQPLPSCRWQVLLCKDSIGDRSPKRPKHRLTLQPRRPPPNGSRSLSQSGIVATRTSSYLTSANSKRIRRIADRFRGLFLRRALIRFRSMTRPERGSKTVSPREIARRANSNTESLSAHLHSSSSSHRIRTRYPHRPTSFDPSIQRKPRRPLSSSN